MSGRARPSRQRRAELSQHFLREASAARLVHATSVSKTDLVIEIGAGRGALTKSLVKRAGRVVAIELDGYLAKNLRANIRPHPGVSATVVTADFLAFELPTEGYCVIGNIPYAKSTEIIRKLANDPNPPRDAWLVVQRELAYRMCGKPFAKESLWSLRLKPFWHLEIVDRLRKSDFNPPPSVESVYLQMSHRGRPLIHEHEVGSYLDLLENAFRTAMPVSRALRTKLTKRQIRYLALDLRFSVEDKPSELMFEQWLGIFRFVRNLERSGGLISDVRR